MLIRNAALVQTNTVNLFVTIMYLSFVLHMTLSALNKYLAQGPRGRRSEVLPLTP